MAILSGGEENEILFYDRIPSEEELFQYLFDEESKYKIIRKKDNLINVMRVDNIDYISLTNLARYKNPNNPGDVVIKWMSNKSSFDFYSLWEELFNENFKLAESREFKNDSTNNYFGKR